MRVLLVAVALGAACTSPEPPRAAALIESAVSRGDGEGGRHLIVLDVDDVPSSLDVAIAGEVYDRSTAKPFDFTRYGRVGSADVVKTRLIERLKSIFGDFDVEVSLGDRSAAERATCAIVVSPDSSVQGHNVGGGAGLDCGNEDERETVFVREPLGPTRAMSDEALGRELDLLATLCAHELGHSFGLTHAEGDEDVMTALPRASSSFVRGSRARLPGSSCHDTAKQDTAELLEHTLGARGAAHRVKLVIAAPPVASAATSFSVEAAAEPAADIARMYVLDREHILAIANGPRISLEVRPQVVGRQRITFVAESRDGKRARRSVVVRVGEGGAPDQIASAGHASIGSR